MIQVSWLVLSDSDRSDLKYSALHFNPFKERLVALLPIIQYPDPVLAAKAEPVTEFNDELRKLAADMAETMYAAPGIGLAANQVGSLKRIVVIDITEEKNSLIVLVNPYVKSHSDQFVEGEEGCLSLKGLYEKVTRPDSVIVCAQDLDGKSFEIEADGLLAVCLQHELDHLDGTVFIDHLSRLKKDRAKTKLRKLRKND
jgi:peptide deformylase